MEKLGLKIEVQKDVTFIPKPPGSSVSFFLTKSPSTHTKPYRRVHIYGIEIQVCH